MREVGKRTSLKSAPSLFAISHSRSKRSPDVSILKGSELAGADMEGDYLIGPGSRNAISGLLLLIGPTIWAILD